MESKLDNKAQGFKTLKLLNGTIACSAKPKLKFLTDLKSLNKVSMVITLLSESEEFQEIQEECEKIGLAWVHCPLKGASSRLLTVSRRFNLIRETLTASREQLLSGEKLLVHCAAGIHRTGVFTYSLLMLCGLEKSECLVMLNSLKANISDKMGEFRLRTAENLVRLIQGNALVPDISIDLYEYKDTDFINQKDSPLLWIKAEVSQEFLKFSFMLSNTNLDKIVPGYEICMGNPGLDPLFIEHRPLRSISTCILDIEQAQNLLFKFISCSTNKNSCKIAGVNCHLEREIISKHFPIVYDYLFYRIIEINSGFRGFGFEGREISTPTEDFTLLKKLKESYFKQT